LLRQHGRQWCMSRISAFNKASMASHSRLNARPVGTATFIVVGPAQLMLASAAPRLSICWGARDRPVLEVAAPRN
jgi:hypothetical protein